MQVGRFVELAIYQPKEGEHWGHWVAACVDNVSSYLGESPHLPYMAYSVDSANSAAGPSFHDTHSRLRVVYE